MSNKQRNDNKEQERANFYKVLVAIKYALEKDSYKEIIIEHKGDVTFDNVTQIEVKHVKSKLSDKSKEFWNTFYNWIKDIDNAEFKEFILHTTQKLTNDTFFNRWGKNFNSDLHNLRQIFKNADFSLTKKNSSQYFYNEIFNSKKYNENHILETIKKIRICHSQKNDEELIEEIAKQYNTSIPENRDVFVRKYLGGTIYSEVCGRGKWILSKVKFYEISIKEVQRFIDRPKIRFYDDYLEKEPTESQISNYYGKKFVEELKHINCEQDNINEAITDYWKTASLIIELQNFDDTFISQEFKKYQKHKVYRKLKNSKDILKPIDDMEKNKEISKQFYKTAKVWTPLSFESIPAYEYIQHGTMHRIVEDEDNEGFNFSWLIEKK